MDEALKIHKDLRGKIELGLKSKINNLNDLSLLYTPGVGKVSSLIAENKEAVWNYTNRGNWVAIVTDGSAVLGLGDIGPEAALPVMEGKAVLFKEFAGIDAFPICLNTQSVDEIVSIVKAISPSFGGINLEDISAPRCFEIESRLKKELDIPVFHDDQHGTAIVVLAGLINALKLVGKEIEEVKIVINGSGAAGIAIANILKKAGAENIIMVDSRGIVNKNRSDLNSFKLEALSFTNKDNLEGDLKMALKDSDVFIGVSKGNLLTKTDIGLMNKNSIVFALANPIPEILPDEAYQGGALVVATGRSDFPNQINNVLAFPGIFKGVLDSRFNLITEEMKLAAAYALASCVKDLSKDKIIPNVFDKQVVNVVSEAIKNLVN